MSHKKSPWILTAGLYFIAFIIIFSLSYLMSEANALHSGGQTFAETTQLSITKEPVSPQTNDFKNDSNDKSINSSTNNPANGLTNDLSKDSNTDPNLFFDSGFAPQGTILRLAGNYYSSFLKAYMFHAGTDYAEPEGAVIRANQAGIISFAGSDPILGGKVTIDIGNSWSITYGCLENLQVKEGDKVEVGTALGQVAFSTGPEGQGRSQLHYEVWHGDDVQVPSNPSEKNDSIYQ